MAKLINKLSALKIASIKKVGWHGDGGGLWLQVTATGSRSWIFRFTKDGKQRVLGLGATHTITLAEAREKARRLRQQLLDGIDPAAERKSANLVKALEVAKLITFDDVAADYIQSKRHEWANQKHVAQWESTLSTYASPFIGKLSVADVDTGLIMQCLNPIWATKTETASRLRGRIESVLAYATTSGYRQGENPARWKGHLENLLPKASKVTKVQNLPSLPWLRVPAFLTALSGMDGVAARALEFAILTATRSGEVRGARWGEFDLDEGVWTIPAERMKAKREHQVPLSAPATKLLKALLKDPRKADAADLVFPGMKKDNPLSDMSLTRCIQRLNEKADPRWADENDVDIVPHGFRSSFRMWAAEATDYPREIAEHALAHSLPDRVEAAYQRGTQLVKRADLMKAWATWCKSSPAGNVVKLRSAA